MEGLIMNIFQKICKSVAISVFGLCLWSNIANAITADHAVAGMDGAGTAVVIWREVDPDTDNHEYRGTVGNGPTFEITTISDPTTFEGSTPPQLAAAKAITLTSTIAAAAWTAADVTLGNSVVFVVTATSSGWSASPIALTPDDGSEVPQNDHRIDISPDGQTITVTWSSFFPSTGDTIIRFAIGIDGGGTSGDWTTFNLD